MPPLRPVSSRVLERVFERDGFVFDRQHGDHRIFVKNGCKRPLVIPDVPSVPVFIVKNLLRTAEMSRDRYFELLRGG